jgi:hypothetical protein
MIRNLNARTWLILSVWSNLAWNQGPANPRSLVAFHHVNVLAARFQRRSQKDRFVWGAYSDIRPYRDSCLTSRFFFLHRKSFRL